MLAILRQLNDGWLRRGVNGQPRQAPAEAVALRCIGLGLVVASIVSTFSIHPTAGLHGRGPLILLGLVLLLGGAVAAQPRRIRLTHEPPEPPAAMALIVTALAGVTAGAGLLAIAQPHGIWQAGPYFVAIVAATRLTRRLGAVVMIGAIAPFAIGSLIEDHSGAALSIAIGPIPWYLILRIMRVLRDQRDQLDAARASEATAAAAAERGRIAREMHDVLAHSLSALALQLESTRMLARKHGAGDEVTRAINQAHHLAATGLDDARRAIAAARGDELPGPERIEALAGAFGEQSGLPVEVEVRGEPRELAPDARLAVYRTAQEALTNVRRHAAAQRVRISLAYLADSAVLVVEDHAAPGTPPPAEPVAAAGYGLTGMRERAALLGGELLAAPTPDGFRVELRLPAGGTPK